MFPFAESVSTRYPVLSVYLNKGPALGAQLTDVLKPIKELDLDHAQEMSLRADIEKISDLRLERETAPGIGIFSCDGEGWFHMERLHRSVSDFATAGRRPYLRPVRTLPRSTRTKIAVVESRSASLWLMEAGEIRRVEDIVVDETVKKNYGGWQGYSERKAHARSDELVHRHYRETAEGLLALHQRKPFDYIIVGGHKTDTHEFVESLHPYLRNLVAGEFVIDPHTITATGVLEKAAALEAAAERERREEIVKSIMDAEGATRKAALGIPDLVDATNLKAVQSLVVVTDSPRVPGAICDECTWMSMAGGECLGCGAEMRLVSDVVDEVIEAVLRDRGVVEGIGPDTVLDDYGAGGLLRFAVT